MQKNANKTILLVEDEAIISLSTSKILQKNGYDVLVVHKGEKAIELATANPEIDLVLMDINLGAGIDGVEAARKILLIKSIPIIFLTAHSEKEIVDKVKSITRYGYVVKNSGEFVLLEAISMALELFEVNRKLLYDINKIEQDEVKLKNRELILSSITVFAEKIFKSGINDKNYNFILSELGKAFDVSRTYIFKKTEENDEMVILKQEYEWCAEGVSSVRDVLDVENFIVQKDSLFFEKVKKFITDGHIIGYTKEMDNEYENYLMEVQKLRSYLFVSIFVNNEWWGMIGFDECKYDRFWHQYEIHALKTVSNIIGGAIQQYIADQELADSRQLYYTLLDSSPDSVSVTDLKGNLIFSSKHAMELFGYVPDENRDGTSAFSWVSPQYRETAFCKFSEIISTGIPDTDTFILKRKDDSEFYAEITASRYDDGAGTPKGLIIVTRDITEVLKTKQALENEAISRRTLIEGSSDGIVVIDENGKVAEANKKFCEMIGYSLSEVKEMHVCQWDDKFNRSDLEQMITKIDEKGDFFETIHKRKDGTKFDVEVSSNAAVVNGKKLIFCVCRNITGKKEFLQIMKESEEKFSKIFHNSPVGISINRISDGAYMDINDALLKIGGYSRDEVIGRTTVELGVYDLKTRSSYMEKLKKFGKISNEEITYLRRDGTFANVIISMEPIEINGEMNILGTAIDVTDKKHSQEELIKSLNEKNILLKELQHRVKNNLSVISGLLNLEMGNLDDKNSINIFQNSITRINSLSSIYEQLYSTDDISRIDLNIYLSNLIESLERTYKINDKILLITSVKAGTFIDLKRSVLIGLIFNELITNSMKYAYPAGGEGAIHSGISIENGIAALYVKDNGKGMPVGFDINSARSLGLKLVKMLTEQLEGSLEIESKHGTLVRIRFSI